MTLTRDNYHSEWARKTWLSSSAVKQAMRCEHAWNEYRTGRFIDDESKDAYKLGHYFETFLSGTDSEKQQFIENNQDMFSSRGKTKGNLKAQYRSAQECVDAVKSQPFLMDIINRSKKQVILTGELFGAPFRVMYDLLAPDGSIYDLKLMKSFDREWSNLAESYVEWYEYWRYDAQMWIYREVARQNGINVPNVGLIAASKSNRDIQAIRFSENAMVQAGSDVEYTVGRMLDIINGDEPIRCESCQVCLKTKKINNFVEV